jgi:hypothetical protein
VVRIHGYNPSLRSVKREFAEASEKFRRDVKDQAADPPDDYVVFVHYAWPSECFGAGGPCGWFRAMPVGLLLLLALGEVALGVVFTLMLLRAVV